MGLGPGCCGQRRRPPWCRVRMSRISAIVQDGCFIYNYAIYRKSNSSGHQGRVQSVQLRIGHRTPPVQRFCPAWSIECRRRRSSCYRCICHVAAGVGVLPEVSSRNCAAHCMPLGGRESDVLRNPCLMPRSSPCPGIFFIGPGVEQRQRHPPQEAYPPPPIREPRDHAGLSWLCS